MSSDSVRRDSLADLWRLLTSGGGSHYVVYEAGDQKTHAVGLVVNGKAVFFFDPNFGAYTLDSSLTGDAFLQEYLRVLHDTFKWQLGAAWAWTVEGTKEARRALQNARQARDAAREKKHKRW
jgi:hypothetical protein